MASRKKYVTSVWSEAVSVKAPRLADIAKPAESKPFELKEAPMTMVDERNMVDRAKELADARKYANMQPRDIVAIAAAGSRTDHTEAEWEALVRMVDDFQRLAMRLSQDEAA